MKLPPFELDQWLDRFKSADIAHDLASSTGPRWTVADVMAQLDPDERAELERLPLSYGHAAGGRALREAIAALHGVDAADVVVTTGASEAFHILFASVAGPDAEVLVPEPAFPPLLEMPRALGLDVRTYRLRPERGFALSVDEVAAQIGPRTRLLVVNSPHNPTGTVVDRRTWAELAALARERRVTLASDEVYWPLTFGEATSSAAAFPEAIVVGSLSKAISLSGLRIGWIIDRQAERRLRLVNSRMYFTISNSPLGELLGGAALRRAESFLARTRAQAEAGRAHLLAFLARNAELMGGVPPQGGTVAFPWLTFTTDSRPFCEALAAEGVLVAPGDCFGMPRHFRVGFAAAPRVGEALEVAERVLRRQAAGAALVSGRRSAS